MSDGHPMLDLWMKSFGELLKLLRDQPRGSVVLEDECKNQLEPSQLIQQFGERAFGYVVTEIATGNHALIETALDDQKATFRIHWSASRQGFVFYNTRIHYFIQKEFWNEKERPDWAREDCLISLCKLSQIQNDRPIIDPNLDNPLVCQRCLKRIRESGQS